MARPTPTRPYKHHRHPPTRTPIHAHPPVAQLSEAGPLAEFDAWFKLAASSGLAEPNAMSLATATPGGATSVRYVLLKGYDERGFVW